MPGPVRYLLLVFYLLFLLSTPAVSQEVKVRGYIVTYTGDTIKGQIVQKNTYRQSIRFKSDQALKFEDLNTEKLSAFGILDSGIFLSRKVSYGGDSVTVFLDAIIIGKPMSLFRYKSSFYIEKNGIYHELKKAAKTGSVGHKEYARTVNSLILDCPSVIPKITSLSFSAKTFTNVVRLYNACVNPGTIDKISSKPFVIGIKGGIVYSDLEFDDFAVNYSAELTSSFGIFIENSISPRFTIRPEVNFVTRHAVYSVIDNTHTYGPNDYELTITYNVSYLQVAVPVNYKILLRNNLTGMLSAGPSLGSRVSNSSNIVHEQAPGFDIEMASNELGFFYGAALYYDLSSSTGFILEYRNERTSSRTAAPEGYDFKWKSSYFNFGLRFILNKK